MADLSTDYAPVQGARGGSVASAMGPYPVESPVWWLDRLHKQLSDRRVVIEKFDKYYEGEHRLSFATEKFRLAFGGLFDKFADNWCGIVVDAVEERLDVTGFRLGPEAVRGDKEAWSIWQANQMDAESQIAHVESFVNGCSYVMVGPPDPPGSSKYPLITVEHPNQVIVENRPGSRVRAAALKEWLDDWTGYLMATVYLSDRVYKFQSQSRYRGLGDVTSMSRPKWIVRDGEDVDGDSNPLNEVPVVPLYNKPRLLRGYASEIRQVLPIQNAVNKLVMDMVVASEFQAIRQRWATGLEIPIDPDTNQPIEAYKTALDKLWISESQDTEFGEFGTVDLRNFVQAIEMLVQHIASQTRTPPHYFFLRGQFPSGESIVAAETGLVRKAMRRSRHFGESWEEVIRLAFLAAGDPAKAEAAMEAETIWADSESRSEAQHMDAAVKRKQVEVPVEQIWEDIGYSEAQIERFKKMNIENPPKPVPSLMGGGNGQIGAAPPEGGYGG